MSLLRTKSLDQGILSPIKEQETTPDGNEQVNRFSEFTGMPAIGAGDGELLGLAGAMGTESFSGPRRVGEISSLQ
jgi:hypothetical protein